MAVMSESCCASWRETAAQAMEPDGTSVMLWDGHTTFIFLPSTIINNGSEWMCIGDRVQRLSAPSGYTLHTVSPLP